MTKRLGSFEGIGLCNDGGGIVGLSAHGDNRFLLRVSETGVSVFGSVEDGLKKPFAQYSPILIAASIDFVVDLFYRIKDTVRHNFTPSPG